MKTLVKRMNIFLKFTEIAFISVLVFGNIAASVKIPIIVNDSGLEFRATVASAKVGDALNELHIILTPEDIVLPDRASKIRPADNIFIKRSILVSLFFDGQKKDINTHLATVGELLKEHRVELKESDKIIPSKDASIVSGLSIEVIRVTKDIKNKEVLIPVKTINQDDSGLSLGKTKIIQKGEAGLIVEEWEITYENGKEVNKKLLKKETTRPMKQEIVAIGTKVEIGQTYTGLGTWYDAPGRAASLQFSFGTKVKVTNLESGAEVVVTINDRGPYGEGRIIDLAKEAFSKIAPLSKGVVKVRVEEIL